MSGGNKIDRKDGSAIDSIWSPAFSTLKPNGLIQFFSKPLTSIFATPVSSKHEKGSTQLDGEKTNFTERSKSRTYERSLQRALIVQSGETRFALDTTAIQEVTRVPAPQFFDSGPLATLLRIRERKLFFSALDSLMGITTTPPKRGMPVLIIGQKGKEAAILVDRVIGISNVKYGQIMTEDSIFPNQMGWLVQENKKKAAIIDMDQILDRILFESDRVNQ